jgi:hypothetical protein
MTAQFTHRGICAMRLHSRDSYPFLEPRKPRVLLKRSAEERVRLLPLFGRSGQTHKQFGRTLPRKE